MERLTVRLENGQADLKVSELNDHCEFCYNMIQKLAEYEDLEEHCKELDNTGIIGEYVGIPIIEVPALISWLNDQKYINIDETSDDMTEEFEKEHQWELSRNCFINKMIKKLEELK